MTDHAPDDRSLANHAPEATDTARKVATAVGAPPLARFLAIATTIQIVATATVLALTAVTPLVAADLGVGANWIGYQVSLVYFGGIFASATAGTFVRRYGPIAIEQIVLLAFVIGFLGLAGGTLATVIIGSLAVGAGYGLNNPASSHILYAVTPPAKRNLVYSIKQAGVPLGAVVASIVFPPVAERIGWNLAFTLAAGVPLCLVVVLRLQTHQVHFERDPLAPFAAGLIIEQQLIWSKPELRALAQLGFLFSGVQLSLSAFTVTMLVHDGRWSLIAAGWAAALMQVGGAVGRIAWGHVADRLGARFAVLALIGALSGSLGIACAFMMAWPWGVQVAIMMGLGFCASGWNGVHLAEAARVAPTGFVGPVTGGVLVYIFIGVVVGPAFFAAVFGLFDNYAVTIGLSSALSLVGMVLALRMQLRSSTR